MVSCGDVWKWEFTDLEGGNYYLNAAKLKML
jgi:hypothetical protein